MCTASNSNRSARRPKNPYFLRRIWKLVEHCVRVYFAKGGMVFLQAEDKTIPIVSSAFPFLLP